jgi:hypothetical protein
MPVEIAGGALQGDCADKAMRSMSCDCCAELDPSRIDAVNGGDCKLQSLIIVYRITVPFLILLRIVEFLSILLSISGSSSMLWR